MDERKQTKQNKSKEQVFEVHYEREHQSTTMSAYKRVEAVNEYGWLDTL